MKKQVDLQMNVAGLRRNIKNIAHNYSDAQKKVREATSNDPWGPSSTIMAEVADLTYNVVAFSEIMQMIWKRLNDHGKNWRHVYKALLLLEYLIKTGTEKVAQQCKENIYAIQTLKDFQYNEEGKDQGLHVREKAKQLVSLLKDDEKLKNERARALKAKERFARTASGFGSDGAVEGPKDSPTWTDSEPRAAAAGAAVVSADLDLMRPQTVGEEELQLQLAMAMSKEEADQEEQKRRSDDVRLQLAISQSEQDFNTNHDKPKHQESHLMDLLDISFGATGISSPPQHSAPSGDPWALPPRPQPAGDPWSRTSSPPVNSDPWLNSASAPPMAKPPIPVNNLDNWPSQNQSPSITSGSSDDGWLQNGTGHPATNGNIVDPWLSKTAPEQIDPWLTSNVKADPWAPAAGSTDMNGPFGLPGSRPSPVGAVTSNDMDEFDIITNRSKSAQLPSASPNRLGSNNNLNNNNHSSSLLDDLDPLSSNLLSTSATKKTPLSFLGENSALVNLDNLIKPITTTNNSGNQRSDYNPFGDTPQPKNNLFQQNQPQVPSINQLKQSPFPVTLNQDPWAPVTNPAPTQNMNAANNNNWMSPQSSNPFLS